MATKKSQPAEAVKATEPTDVAPVAESAAEDTTEAPVAIETPVETPVEAPAEVPAPTPAVDLNARVQVATPGRPADLSSMDMTPANICLECGTTWPPDKCIASCRACGGKTVSGFKYQAKKLVAADEARFTGKSAEDLGSFKTATGQKSDDE